MTQILMEKPDVEGLQKLYEKMLEHDIGSEPYNAAKLALKEFEEHLGRKYGFIASKIRGVRNLNGEIIPKDNDYLGYMCPYCHKIMKEKKEFEDHIEQDAAAEKEEKPEKKVK